MPRFHGTADRTAAESWQAILAEDDQLTIQHHTLRHLELRKSGVMSHPRRLTTRRRPLWETSSRNPFHLTSNA